MKFCGVLRKDPVGAVLRKTRMSLVRGTERKTGTPNLFSVRV